MITGESEQCPLVSIGMPVYNEERFIDLALNSLRAQTYPSFELVISDNGSTDGTQAICEAAARDDSRIKYIRQPANRGAAWNFAHVLQLASGDYFMWAGGHDQWKPDFVRACIEILQHEPEVVVAYTKAQLIDGSGQFMEIMPDDLDTRGLTRPPRVRRMIADIKTGNMIHGVFRTKVLRQLRLGLANWGADLVILMEANLYGSSALVQEPLFLRRQFRKRQDDSVEKQEQLIRLDPAVAQATKTIRPTLDLGKAYVLSALHTRMPVLQKSYILFNVIYFYVKRWRKSIQRELFV